MVTSQCKNYYKFNKSLKTKQSKNNNKRILPPQTNISTVTTKENHFLVKYPPLKNKSNNNPLSIYKNILNSITPNKNNKPYPQIPSGQPEILTTPNHHKLRNKLLSMISLELPPLNPNPRHRQLPIRIKCMISSSRAMESQLRKKNNLKRQKQTYLIYEDNIDDSFMKVMCTNKDKKYNTEDTTLLYLRRYSTPWNIFGKSLVFCHGRLTFFITIIINQCSRLNHKNI